MSLKSVLRISISSLAIALIPVATFAHVVVTPSSVGIGSNQVFSVSVPDEGTTNVIKVRLDIPSGVTNVFPTGISGWTINTATDKSDDVTQITWSNGVILPGQRQDFTFSAQAPATSSNIIWKAYETDTNGSVTHWDQVPAGSDDSTGNAGPYSITKVVNDLTSSSTSSSNTFSPSIVVSLLIAILALIISILSLISRRKR